MNILALDLATKTGFAYIKAGKLTSGSWHNPVRYSDSPGAFMAGFSDWLADMRRWSEPQAVVWEMTHPYSGKAQMVSYGLITRVQEWAYRHRITQSHVYPNTLKKFITGNGKAGKISMVEHMRVRWALPMLRDEDEADALAVLVWAVKALTDGQEAPGRAVGACRQTQRVGKRNTPLANP